MTNTKTPSHCKHKMTIAYSEIARADVATCACGATSVRLAGSDNWSPWLPREPAEDPIEAAVNAVSTCLSGVGLAAGALIEDVTAESGGRRPSDRAMCNLVPVERVDALRAAVAQWTEASKALSALLTMGKGS